MKKEILVLGSLSSDPGETQELKDYQKYFTGHTDLQIKFLFAHFDDLSFVISPDEFTLFDHRNNKHLKDYDLVILRGRVRPYIEIAYCVCRYLKINKVPFFNNYLDYKAPSKLQQAISFYELKVPFLKTIYSKNPQLLASAASSNLSYALILKDSYGAHGKNNYLIKSKKRLEEVLKTNPNIRFIAQEYFPNKCDYRFLILGNQQVIIRRSALSGTHLNNTTLGAKAELVKDSFFPKRVHNLARKIADNAKMTIAGVDILYDERSGSFVFLEINSQPQIMTGAFPEEKANSIGKYIDDLFSN